MEKDPLGVGQTVGVALPIGLVHPPLEVAAEVEAVGSVDGHHRLAVVRLVARLVVELDLAVAVGLTEN